MCGLEQHPDSCVLGQLPVGYIARRQYDLSVWQRSWSLTEVRIGGECATIGGRARVGDYLIAYVD